TVESAIAWAEAIKYTDGPSALIFSRQTLNHQARTEAQIQDISKGGYILKECEGTPELILISTGSEVGVTMEAAEQLQQQGKAVRVVSMPCCEVFEKQSQEYKSAVLPSEVTRRIAVEAGVTQPWHRYVGLEGEVIGMQSYGESAPGGELFKHFGFTTENIVDTANNLF
ncbi:MAG: transketolase C-terminal domain-containing protein, partial [Gammaproteobacteria bacterium]